MNWCFSSRVSVAKMRFQLFAVIQWISIVIETWTNKNKTIILWDTLYIASSRIVSK